eukprot:PRCOL_00004815-RA
MSPSDVLPQDMLATLPPDPAAQHELAVKLAAYAFNARAAGLEAEVAQLKSALAAKTNALKGVEAQASELRLELAEARACAEQSLEEQSKLVGEKDALAATVNRLNRENAKLGAFKRNLLQTLQDDDDVQAGAPVEGIGAPGYSAAKREPVTPSLSLYQSQSAVPTPTNSALRLAGMTPAGGSAPPGASQVDGKEFFRRARATLANEQFTAFLRNIKELNAHRQTREETLQRAADIFGADNAHLYTAFEGLLTRHMPLAGGA